MSAAEFDRLVQAFQQNPDLLDKLKEIAPEQRLQWAQDKGFHVTAEELEKLCAEEALSDDELEQVAGGDDGWTPGPGGGTTTGGDD